jgi:hypothetical protein
MPITADRNLEPGVQVLDDEVEGIAYINIINSSMHKRNIFHRLLSIILPQLS